MRILTMLMVVVVLALAGCGNDEDEGTPAGQARPDMTVQEPDTATQPPDTTAAAPATEGSSGTTLIVSDSEFGRMLFDADEQAIYIFENDRKGESACYDECAKAWPPVLTEDDPVAGDGINAALMGTTKRRDGTLQITYAGQPLYYYAHEDPGEVRCHNVNLNGGLWWVVGPEGRRRP
jgi:predicted lipoprotein with Yx(FWY)xxD motif